MKDMCTLIHAASPYCFVVSGYLVQQLVSALT